MSNLLLDEARRQLANAQQAVKVADAEHRRGLARYIMATTRGPLSGHMTAGMDALSTQQKLTDTVAERDRWAKLVAFGEAVEQKEAAELTPAIYYRQAQAEADYAGDDTE